MSENPIYIKRKIDTKIQEYIKLPEILAIVGPRQAGKTTYLKHLITEKAGVFVSFEDVDILNYPKILLMQLQRICYCKI